MALEIASHIECFGNCIGIVVLLHLHNLVCGFHFMGHGATVDGGDPGHVQHHDV
jgi:hypothetical protein